MAQRQEQPTIGGDTVQPSTGNGDTGSFYLGDGFADYSGGLEPGIPVERLQDTGESRDELAGETEYSSEGFWIKAGYFPARLQRADTFPLSEAGESNLQSSHRVTI